jgi:hypothetical protein
MLTAKYQESWKVCGYKVPQYFFFVLSGALCDVAQALIDYAVSLLYRLEWERATVCWTTSYTLSIILRHSSHRLLVFGEFEGTYCSSLTRTYMTYSTSIVVSMLSNHVFVSFLNMSHRVAWVVTMLWTGIYNYFALKASWRRKDGSGGSSGTGVMGGACLAGSSAPPPASPPPPPPKAPKVPTSPSPVKAVAPMNMNADRPHSPDTSSSLFSVGV